MTVSAARLLQIPRRLRHALPASSGSNAAQALGFKYDSRLTGIPMHADFAVNVNFWVTPTTPTSIPRAAA